MSESQKMFSGIELIPEIYSAIEMLNFETATPIQLASIPVIRTGSDIIAKSQTGTGKTLCFAIPALEMIRAEEKTVQVLVLCPTRELAMQAYDEVEKLSQFMPHIKAAQIFGGAAIDRQCMRLRQANIVIGTPGRIMDHMRRKSLKLKNLKMLVLDEADEMLNMGFKEDIETILEDVPECRQTLLFSATMPPAIINLSKNYLNDPQLIEIDKSKATIDGIKQTYIEVPHVMKSAALITLLQYRRPTRAIIFCNTKKMVDEICSMLAEHSITSQSLHSDIQQTQRTAVMKAFKQGKTSVLVATDIAARGIDVNDVDYVINYDLPQNTEYYIHRIGRTGRAGKEGCSITISGGRRETTELFRISREIKSTITRMPLPTPTDITASRGEEIVESVEKAIHDESSLEFDDLIQRLIAKGYSERQIALSTLSLHFHELYSAPIPIIPTTVYDGGRDAVANDRKDDGISWGAISIDIGESNDVQKNHILGAMLEYTNLRKSEVGKIKVLPNRTIVEIPSELVSETVKSVSGRKICGKPVHAEAIRRKDKEPRRYSGKHDGGYDKKPYKKRFSDSAGSRSSAKYAKKR